MEGPYPSQTQNLNIVMAVRLARVGRFRCADDSWFSSIWTSGATTSSAPPTFVVSTLPGRSALSLFLDSCLGLLSSSTFVFHPNLAPLYLYYPYTSICCIYFTAHCPSLPTHAYRALHYTTLTVAHFYANARLPFSSARKHW